MPQTEMHSLKQKCTGSNRNASRKCTASNGRAGTCMSPVMWWVPSADRLKLVRLSIVQIAWGSWVNYICTRG